MNKNYSIEHSREDFDTRVYTDFNKVWNVGDDLGFFIESLDLQDGDAVCVPCCGYGDETKALLSHAKNAAVSLDLTAMDFSAGQLNYAQQNLAAFDNVSFVQGDYRKLPFASDSFDKLILRMGIHEVPFGDQKKVFEEIFRVLKPGGTFYFWSIVLEDKEMQAFVQTYVNFKDSLGGFAALVEHRYFVTEEELDTLFSHAGFMDVSLMRDLQSRWGCESRKKEFLSKSLVRYYQHSVLDTIATIPSHLDSLGDRLVEAFKKRVNTLLAEYKELADSKLAVEREGTDVSFVIPKKMIKAVKPM